MASLSAALERTRVVPVALLLAVASAACAPESARAPVHGVLVISFDALRADVLGTYGHPRHTSPELDAVAGESVVYEHAFSAAPKTPTSFASMFTGRLPHSVLRSWRLNEAETLAALFARAGFRTAAFTNSPQIQAARGFDAGFDEYAVIPKAEDRVVLEAALGWLRENHEDRFLLWIHLLDPHIPWRPVAEAEHLYSAGYRGRFEKEVPGMLALRDPDELARARSLYEGEVFGADRLFGVAWREVQRLGLGDRIAVVVTSDHGEELMDHGLLQHGQLTEENLHVPLLLRLPGGREARRDSTPVGTIDLAPTLLDLAGISEPEHLAGRSLLDARRPQRTLVSVAVTDRGRPAASIRVGSEKLILRCWRSPPFELYDLASDPDERYDIAEASPGRVERLAGLLWETLDADDCESLPLTSSPGTAQERSGLGAEDIEALKALGYLEVEEGAAPDRRASESPPR